MDEHACWFVDDFLPTIDLSDYSMVERDNADATLNAIHEIYHELIQTIDTLPPMESYTWEVVNDWSMTAKKSLDQSSLKWLGTWEAKIHTPVGMDTPPVDANTPETIAKLYVLLTQAIVRGDLSVHTGE